MQDNALLRNGHTRDAGIDGTTFQYLNQLREIRDNMQSARDHYHAIVKALEALEASGMWPAIPGESWEDRGARGNYLRLRWHQDTDGRWDGPDGARSTYIGCKPERIAEARRMTKNRERWEQLEKIRHRLWTWLNVEATSIRHTAAFSDKYPQVQLEGYAPTTEEELHDPAYH